MFPLWLLCVSSSLIQLYGLGYCELVEEASVNCLMQTFSCFALK